MKHQTNTCGCCEGIEKSTPLPTANRPGLAQLLYRVGTHATFLETMLARLSTLCLGSEEECREGKARPLQKLKTREGDDPSIALLDSWATVADVLAFYQERIANEGFLRTATERRSVLELARLVGYKLRPGVSSSVFLAYTLDENLQDEVVIPKGARAQSVPGPGDLPQSFETGEDLKARAAWNNLKPRMKRPQNVTFQNALKINKIFFEGTKTNLKQNDPLLLVYGDEAGRRIIRLAQEVRPDSKHDLTEVTLQETPFLVIAAVDLLRFAVADLSQRLQNGEADVSVLSWFEQVHTLAARILENISLGNFPPVHTDYFSHERIYQYLKDLKDGKSTRVPTPPPAFKEDHLTIFGSFPWDNGEAIAFIEKLIGQAAAMLENTVFRHGLVCLFRHLLQQMLPSCPSEQDALPSLKDFVLRIHNFYSDRKKKAKKIDVHVAAMIGELGLFLQDPETRKYFEKLLKELLDLTRRNIKFLKVIKEWLEGIPVGEDAIQCEPEVQVVTSLGQLTGPLLTSPSLQPPNSMRLTRNIGAAFRGSADAVPQVLTTLNPSLGHGLYQAWSNAVVKTVPPELKSIHALRLTAPLFGYNAQVKMGLISNPDEKSEIKFISVPDGDWDLDDDEVPGRLYLDNPYDDLLPGAYLVIHNGEEEIFTSARAETVVVKPRTAYGLSGKTTQIDLSRNWRDGSGDTMASIRKSVAWVETETLALAQEPLREDIAGDTIELSGLHDGLTSGRWIIVDGERSDIPGASGVRTSELAMLCAVDQIFDEELPGDMTHSVIKIAEELAYRFKRDTVTIYGNVAKATHGETRKEVLGGGDGAKALQSFTLKQPPLTFVSAHNPSGVESTLKLYVNDVQWHEAESLAELSPTDRSFITRTDDEGKTMVVFGNGREGSRLPTGIENIKAEYRNGIGKQGNVKAGQISLLSTRPLGVKEVINPLRASGGADRESRDQARKNAPLVVTALDRLVSVQDYEDFARTYAGIGKAIAVEKSDGRRQVVHVTIAGAEDIPIDESSDLFLNLRQALHDFGDPLQSVILALRELMFIVISARIRIMPDYQWEPVVTKVRSAMLDAFGFEKRELGQDILLSEVISVMQAVRGVAYVDIDVLREIPEKILDPENLDKRRPLTPDEITSRVTDPILDEEGNPIKEPRPRIIVNMADYEDGAIRPAQLAFLTPDVPATLILNQIT